jgi:cyclohexanecarboxylate-CoA ligase
VGARETGAWEWDTLAERGENEHAVIAPDVNLSVGELRCAAAAIARELNEAGVVPGDRVVVALPNSVEFVVIALAVRLCAAVFVNLPWQFRRELLAVAEQTNARVVVVGDHAPDDLLTALGPRRFRPALHRRRGDRSFTPSSRPAGSVAWLAFTSGTTGAPKGAIHTEESLARIPQGFVDRYALSERDCVLVAAPVGHAIGFVYGVELALRARCPMVIVPHWDAELAASLADSRGCTFAAAPTPFLVDLVEVVERGGAPPARLRHFLCGGAPVPSALIERARKSLLATEATPYYGTSECGGVTTCPPGTSFSKVVSTVGRPLEGMAVAIEDGEILVRGAQLARGYWAGDPDAQFRADGWFATGDLGALDADGYLRITGRAKELIIRGGVNISPVEVEEALAGHPDVREVALVGIADPRLGQRVVAAVVPRERQPSLADLRERCDELGLAKVKWPEQVIILERLPRAPTGKLQRAELQRLVEGER